MLVLGSEDTLVVVVKKSSSMTAVVSTDRVHSGQLSTQTRPTWSIASGHYFTILTHASP